MYQKKFCKKTVETINTTCVSFLAKIEPQLLLVAPSVVATLEEVQPVEKKKEENSASFSYSFPPFPFPSATSSF